MATSYDWGSNPKITNAITTDIDAIRSMLNAAVRLRPDLYNSPPDGAIRLVTTSSITTLSSYSDGTWTAMTNKFNINAEKVDGYDVSTSAAKNTIPVYNSKAQLVGDSTGNANTATTLQTAHTFDIAGAITATAVSFNGSADVKLKVTDINFSGSKDDYAWTITGQLPTANGGTGRDDGSATDIAYTINGSTVKASASGQIGITPLLKASFNTAVNPGKYWVTGTYINADTYAAPETSTSSHAVLNVWTYNVGSGTSSTTYIYQHALVAGSRSYTRFSTNAGSSWSAWTAIGGVSYANLTLYVSKSGSDTNVGTQTNPFLTIDAAIKYASGRLLGKANATLYLNVGAGSWGNLYLSCLPFNVHIRPYDGKALTVATSGSTDADNVALNDTAFESIPAFTYITADNTRVIVQSIKANYVRSMKCGSITITSGYIRLGAIWADYGGITIIEKDTTNPIDIIYQTSSTYGFYAANGGYLYGAASRTVRVAETLQNSKFIYVYTATSGRCALTGLTHKLYNSSTIAGTQYSFGYGTSVMCSVSGLPAASTAGTISSGCILNGVPYGGGSTTQWLRADGTWQTISTASGTVQGLVLLSDAVNSSNGVSNGVAATPYAVKAAYDLASSANTTANAALPKAGGTMTGDLILSTNMHGPKISVNWGYGSNYYLDIWQRGSTVYDASSAPSATGKGVYIHLDEQTKGWNRIVTESKGKAPTAGAADTAVTIANTVLYMSNGTAFWVG